MFMANPASLKAHPVTTVPGSKPRALLPHCLQTGATLFHEGDACSGLFEIMSGVFRPSRLTRGVRRYVVGFGVPQGPGSQSGSGRTWGTSERHFRPKPSAGPPPRFYENQSLRHSPKSPVGATAPVENSLG